MSQGKRISNRIRRQVREALDRGLSYRQVAALFGIAVSTAWEIHQEMEGCR